MHFPRQNKSLAEVIKKCIYYPDRKKSRWPFEILITRCVSKAQKKRRFFNQTVVLEFKKAKKKERPNWHTRRPLVSITRTHFISNYLHSYYRRTAYSLNEITWQRNCRGEFSRVLNHLGNLFIKEIARTSARAREFKPTNIRAQNRPQLRSSDLWQNDYIRGNGNLRANKLSCYTYPWRSRIANEA